MEGLHKISWILNPNQPNKVLVKSRDKASLGSLLRPIPHAPHRVSIMRSVDVLQGDTRARRRGEKRCRHHNNRRGVSEAEEEGDDMMQSYPLRVLDRKLQED